MMKDMLKQLAKAKEVEKKLKNIHIEAEEEGVTVIMDAKFSLISVDISEGLWAKQDKGAIEKLFVKAHQKGMKKAQEVAAQNMKEIMGDLGLPGMGG